MSVKKLPKWFTDEFSEGNLRGIRDELKVLQHWSNGYMAAGGKIPGCGILGGPNRSIILINRLLDAYK